MEENSRASRNGADQNAAFELLLEEVSHVEAVRMLASDTPRRD